MEVPATALHGFSAKLWMELRHATEQELPRMTDAWVPLTALERHMDVSRDWLLHTVLSDPDHFVYHVDEDVPDLVKAVFPEYWTNPSTDDSIFKRAYLALRGEPDRQRYACHDPSKARLLKVDTLVEHLEVNKERLLQILHQHPTVFDVIIDKLVGLTDAYF